MIDKYPTAPTPDHSSGQDTITYCNRTLYREDIRSALYPIMGEHLCRQITAAGEQSISDIISHIDADATSQKVTVDDFYTIPTVESTEEDSYFHMQRVTIPSSPDGPEEDLEIEIELRLDEAFWSQLEERLNEVGQQAMRKAGIHNAACNIRITKELAGDVMKIALSLEFEPRQTSLH